MRVTLYHEWIVWALNPMNRLVGVL